MALQTLKMAWSSITSNKMRSFLTMLGIIIGVVALVVLVSIVQGATGQVTDAVSALGTNLLSIRVMDDKGRPLGMRDLEELRSFDALYEVSPTANEIMMLRNGSEEETTQVTGVAAGYAAIQQEEVACGRSFNASDVDNHLYVAIVNPTVVRNVMRLENIDDAVGGEVYLKGIPFTVIGVLPEEDTDTGAFALDMYRVEIPYTTLMRVSGTISGVRSFVASAVSDDRLSELESEIAQWLLRRFDRDEKAFTLINMSSIMGAMDRIMSAMTTMLGGIAAISLLVGGIGIMNIMLVSVTERTREIGIRKAIGAGQGSILMQFLIEALLLSLMGCMLGVLLSGFLLYLINAVSGYDFSMRPNVVILASAFSLVIGMIFGIYPARKAAKKKPIDALHYAG